MSSSVVVSVSTGNPVLDSFFASLMSFLKNLSDRWDLLYRSLSSFLEWNTYPVYEVLVWEDGGVGVPDNLGSLGLGSRLRLLGGDRWRGQVSAVDGMYSEVGTGYIFHMEDDWEFYRGGFIEASKGVLDVYSDISVVS